MVSHDATVGSWTGLENNIAASNTRGTKQVLDMGYLAQVRRGQAILGALGSVFHVQGADGHASVSVMGQAGGTPNLTKIAHIERPAPAVFEGQMKWLRNYADLRADRIPEILSQSNDIMSFFGALAHLNASKTKHTLEVLQLAQYLTVSIEMQVKHWCKSARPVDRSMNVQPVIQTPSHSAFPSGHATEAFVIATVFQALSSGSAPANQASAPAFRLAHRIAANRVVAGVHYPVDSAAGAVLGCMIGEALISIGKKGALKEMSYASAGASDATATKLELLADHDFELSRFADAYPTSEAGTAPAVELFSSLWDQAAGEW